VHIFIKSCRNSAVWSLTSVIEPWSTC